MINVDELLAAEVPPEWTTRPAKVAAPVLRIDPDADLDPARALAASLPPSISGHGGDAALFHAANEVAAILGENAPGIEAALLECFNPRCVPPWDAGKIRREATRAAERMATPEARMMRRHRAAAEVDPFAPAEGGIVLDETRQGKPRPTLTNVSAVLEHVFGDRVRFEECSGRVLCKGVDPGHGYLPDGEWSDAHTSATMQICEGLRLYVSAALVDRAVELHARRHAFNLLRDGLLEMGRAWDGVARIDRALSTYWGAVDNAATRAVSRVWFLSMAARGLVPGAKVDTCPIFIGAQGIRKSSSFRALVGGEFFADSPLPIGDKDAAQAIRGKLLWEFGEHAAISRRERNQVKAFLSQSVDRFRASYGRHMQDVPRTCVFVSSSNDQEVLTDPTGARRFLPVAVHRVDIEAIRRDRVQLLGEAVRRWTEGAPNIRGERSEGGGEPHWPTLAEERALEGVRADATESDVWEELISAWLEGRESFAMAELFDEHTGAIHMTEDRISKGDQMRAAGILRALGWARVWSGKARVWMPA